MTRGMRVGGVLVAFVLLPLPARAAEEDPVRKAIDRGVTVLKKMQDDKPDAERKGRGRRLHDSGAPALVGLTLLECGVPADDKVVQKLAGQLRKDCVELDHTYSLALAIMFFDKLGDPGDVALIQSMGVRLLGGQGNTGGWTYNSDAPSKSEVRRLTDLMTERNSPGVQQPVKQEDSLYKPPPPLPKELKDEVDRIQKRKPDKGDKEEALRGLAGGGDNSNTQFAILGLWVAGRHGVPIDKAMAKVDARFRFSQNGDGGWSYSPVFSSARGGDTSSGAMTCAGLLGLAMSHGVANQAVLRTDPKTPANRLPRDPARDPAVLAGLRALGTSIGRPVDPRKKGQLGRVLGLQKGYYFLWSVERVGVAFNLQTIGNKDWYAWGAQMLLASQDADGAWSGEHGHEIDTCFALLFLRRVNLAKDLTASLRGVKDPGEVKLTAGGVGGEDLIAKGLVSGIVLKDPADVAGDEAAKLSDELVRAPVPDQAGLITKLKDGKGAVYTDALAASIPQLTGGTRVQARDALAERLARMKAGTLRDKLQDDNAEVRRAAAVACYMKDEKSLTPDLIALLEDKEGPVARAAQAVLKELTKQDFGPAPTATAEQRLEAVAAWKDWWRKQGAK